jgi:fructose-specific phosphotransferase system IIC component
MNCTIRRLLVYAAGICVPLVTVGCSQAPTFEILGSVFPAWLVCLAAGVLLTALARWLLVRKGIQLVFPLLTYPCLAAVFIFAMWLVFFW